MTQAEEIAKAKLEDLILPMSKWQPESSPGRPEAWVLKLNKIRLWEK